MVIRWSNKKKAEGKNAQFFQRIHFFCFFLDPKVIKILDQFPFVQNKTAICINIKVQMTGTYFPFCLFHCRPKYILFFVFFHLYWIVS